eukprot:scaffold5614_cov201-Ochromonas_danica.AAC.3
MALVFAQHTRIGALSGGQKVKVKMVRQVFLVGNSPVPLSVLGDLVNRLDLVSYRAALHFIEMENELIQGA